MNVCTEQDEYIDTLETDLRQALWRAELPDGRVVIQDDGRPGVWPSSAWVRLREYLLASGINVVGLWLKFRSHVERHILPAYADGYFLRSVRAET